jgi:hypothetical protein
MTSDRELNLYYVIEPEAAGHWGEKSVVTDRSVHPLVISKLHYRFDGWSGDVLLTSSPVYIITCEAMKKLQEINPTGASFDNVEITTSEQFQHFHPNLKLPEFAWLKVDGKVGHDDFGIVPYRNIRAISYPEMRMVISGRVLNILKPLGIAHADMNEYVPR